MQWRRSTCCIMMFRCCIIIMCCCMYCCCIIACIPADTPQTHRLGFLAFASPPTGERGWGDAAKATGWRRWMAVGGRQLQLTRVHHAHHALTTQAPP